MDFPTISVQAQLPGASPDTVATSVAAPLERHLGQIADVTEMTSTSSVGQARIVLQFGLDRDINGAARDVQAAINAARADLPTSLRSNPTYRKVNPADAPILILALTLEDADPRPDVRRRHQRAVATPVADQRHRPGHHRRLGPAGGAGGTEPNAPCSNTASGWRTCAPPWPRPMPTARRARSKSEAQHYQLYTNDQASHAADYRPLVVA